jgi:hypothetical protein
MTNIQVDERVKNAVDKINTILNEENIMLVPVTTIVNGNLAQRVEVVPKPVQPAVEGKESTEPVNSEPKEA